MPALDGLGPLLVVLGVLALFGVWKVLEIVIWLASGLRWVAP